MPAPDYTADAENEPFKLLGLSPFSEASDVKSRARKLYKKVDDPEKQKKINKAMQAAPEREKVSGQWIIDTHLRVDQTTVSSGEEVTFTATDDMGDAIERAKIRKVSDGTRVGRTDANGELGERLSDTGTGIKFEVEKDHPESDKTYRADTVEVDVERQTVALEFEQCPDSATVGDTISVRVTDGNSGQRDCQVSVDGTQMGTTNSDGDVDVTIPPGSTGSVKLNASGWKDPSRKYTDATETVQVYKQQVSLVFEQAPDSVSVGDSATFRITNGASPVQGAEVSHDQDSDRTDSKGYATLSFADLSLGPTEVSATKSDKGDTSYQSAHHSVTITERTQPLDISLLSSDVVVGQPCRFEVNSAGQSVEGAMVSTSDGKRKWTKPNGEVEMTFERAGPKRVEVVKQDDPKVNYGSDDIKVDVDRRTERLSIEVEATDAKVGDDIDVTVKGADDTPIQGASVSPANGTGATTNNAGEAEISFTSAGRQRVDFDKDNDDTARYVGNDVHVQVKERPKELEIVSAPDTNIGDPVQIKVHDHTNNPVQGITVKVDGGGVSKEETTDHNGVATFHVTGVNPPQFMEATAVDYGGKYDMHAQEYFRLDN